MKRWIAGIVIFTFLVTNLFQEAVGIDWQKAFASTIPNWYLPTSGSIGELSDAAGAVQSFQTDLFTGAATMSIPIFAPPGRRGLTPQVSLNYSSSSGNSLVGWGWSAPHDLIQRSTKFGPPAYNDEQDTFILSLQGVNSELVKVNTNEYHAKHENGEFLKIIYENGYWTIWNKSGTQFILGESPDRRITNQLGVFAWCLEKVKDTLGNTIEYIYEGEPGEDPGISRILYNGNEDHNFPATHAIEFEYESRPDELTSYISGAKSTTAKRLKQITLRVQGQAARHYHLAYEETPIVNRSRLISVQECGVDNQTCLPPTAFTYQNLENGFEEGVDWRQYSTDHNPISRISGDGETIATADLNGDGLPDRIKKTNDTTWQLHRNSGFSHNEPGIAWAPIQGGTGNWAAMRATSSGTSTYVNLIDMNSDGRLDRVVKGTGSNAGGSDGWAVQYNLGDGFGAEQYYGPVPTENRDIRVEGSTGSENDVFYTIWDTTDMNGDGFVDRVHRHTGSMWRVYFGNAAGFAVNPLDWGPIEGGNGDLVLESISSYDNDGRGTNDYVLSDLIDMNGDGLPDRVVAGKTNNAGGTTGFAVQYNNGRGFEPETYFGPTQYTKIRDEDRIGDYQDVMITVWDVIDMNADGLPDRVRKQSNSEWYVYFNTGRAFSETPVSWGPLNGSPDESAMRLFDTDTRNTLVELMDLNGDGLIDRVLSGALDSVWTVQLAKGLSPDLLKTIDNGRGGVTTITYTPSTEFYNAGSDGVPDLPFPVMVVTKVETQDGIGHTYTTTYDYADGNFDPTDREFRGFNRTRVFDVQGNYQATWFYQDDIFKGKPYLQESRDAGEKLYTQVWNTWKSSEPYPGVFFSYIEEVTNWLYDGNDTFKLSETLQLYDEYGNVIESINWGEVDDVNWDTPDGDEIRVKTQFAYNTDLWILDKPKHVETYDVDWNRLQESWFYYDDSSDFNTPPVKGNLTKKEELPKIGAQHLKTEMTYDEYGNLLTVKDARGLITTNQYDDSYHLYLTRVTNMLGHAQEFAYDPLIAQITQSTDPNGQVSRTIYDALGRTMKTISPLDTESAPTQAVCYDDVSIPNKVITNVKAKTDAGNLNDPCSRQQGDYLTSYSFMDGLGRELERRSPAENWNQQIVTGYVTFDERGQIKKQYAPYSADFSDQYLAPPADFPHVIFHYDPAGRRVQTQFPFDLNDPNDDTYITVVYDDFIKTVTDQNGHQKRYTQDVYGNLVKVEEFNEGETYETAYQYDPLGRLIQTTDDHGNETHVTYDMLGRKLTMQDPDMGYWTYTYDNNGNLKTQTDALNQTMTFDYDELNRLVKKTYPDFSEINYTYDACEPQTCGGFEGDVYGTGRLLKVDDLSSIHIFRYDALGRVTQDQKSLDDGYDYSFTRIYDPLGRVTSLEYPDGEILALTFNGMGEAETLTLINADQSQTPLITEVIYNPSAQLAKIVYGNGVETEYFYDPQTLRLSHLVTEDAQHIPLQNLEYQFDAAGNVLNMIDAVNTNTQTFQYDDIDRLIQAEGSYGTRTYDHDSIGNLTVKGLASLEYNDPNHPHAVTKYEVPGTTYDYQYDANGNMTKRKRSRSGENLFYDYDNRLIRVEKFGLVWACAVGTQCQPPSSIVAEYQYDATGQRIKKEVAGTGTSIYYLGKDFEKSYHPNGSLTRKAFFLGSTRIAEEEETDQGVSYVRFFHQDHLGSTNVVTNLQGEQVLLMEYLPFGEVKVRTGSDPVHHTFTGHEEDLETSL
ncbi:MAG: hypothetical protein COW12_01375, partial [Candidatus Omnitrophica bacterium CG12_big_fil_rev_8_21_14_0_65_45_16]